MKYYKKLIYNVFLLKIDNTYVYHSNKMVYVSLVIKILSFGGDWP